MKKIVIVTTTIYPEVGGGELYMLNLAKEFSKIYDVTVLCITFCDDCNDTVIDGVKIKYLPKSSLFGHYFPSFSSLFKYLVRLDPDIIYTSSPGIEDFFVVFINFFLRKVLIMTYHGTFSGKKLYVRFFNYLYSKFIFKFYSKIIVTTQKYFLDLTSLGVNYVSHVPCGVELEKISLDKNSFLHSTKNLLFVAMLTSLHQHKRLHILLQAMLQLSDFHLDVIGDGDLKTLYEEEAKNLGLKNVKFHGLKIGKDLVDFYKKSNIFILPSNSKQEGFGIVLLEALGNGCKIIIGEKCGGAFLINENPAFGSLYDGSVEDLVKKIHYVYSAPHLNSLYVERYLTQYTWANVAKKILENIS